MICYHVDVPCACMSVLMQAIYQCTLGHAVFALAAYFLERLFAWAVIRMGACISMDVYIFDACVNQTSGVVMQGQQNFLIRIPLGHSFLTFGPEFHMYTCMHVFARLIASHHTVKVHNVTAERTMHNKIAYFIHEPSQK